MRRRRALAKVAAWGTRSTGTRRVHLTEKATLVLTVQVTADSAPDRRGRSRANPVWRQSFAHMATARRHEWRARNLHWGVPKIAPDGAITVDPIDESTTEAEFLRSELDDMVKRANEHNDHWTWLKSEAQTLTDIFRSGPRRARWSSGRRASRPARGRASPCR